VVISKIKTSDPDNILSLSGNFTDIETLMAAKIFLKGINSDNYECRIDNVKIDPLVRSSYIFNSGIANIEKTDAILLVGTNPRWEASILNARIRKSYIKNNIPIALIGNKKNLTYEYKHLGNSLKYLEEILTGKSDFSKTLNSAKKPMIIIGQSALSGNDGEAVLHICREISVKYNFINENWNGFNVLNSNISKVGALDIGFFNKKFSSNIVENINNFSSRKNSIIFLLGVDEIDMGILNNSFVVYVGHHGDKGAHRADVILPSPAYTEKDCMFVNLEGRIIKTQLCHPPLGESKNEWKIFRALGEMMSINMPFNNLFELREQICIDNPIFKALNTLHKNPFPSFGKSGQILDKPIKDLISNFYMTDPISRASKTMAECSYNLLTLSKEEVV